MIQRVPCQGITDPFGRETENILHCETGVICQCFLQRMFPIYAVDSPALIVAHRAQVQQILLAPINHCE